MESKKGACWRQLRSRTFSSQLRWCKLVKFGREDFGLAFSIAARISGTATRGFTDHRLRHTFGRACNAGINAAISVRLDFVANGGTSYSGRGLVERWRYGGGNLRACGGWGGWNAVGGGADGA